VSGTPKKGKIPFYVPMMCSDLDELGRFIKTYTDRKNPDRIEMIKKLKQIKVNIHMLRINEGYYRGLIDELKWKYEKPATPRSVWLNQMLEAEDEDEELEVEDG